MMTMMMKSIMLQRVWLCESRHSGGWVWDWHVRVCASDGLATEAVSMERRSHYLLRYVNYICAMTMISKFY